MIVRCLRLKPTSEQMPTLGKYYQRYGVKHDSHLTILREYLVLGVVFNSSYAHMALGVSVTVKCDHGHLEWYPLALFEIVDGSPDPEWVFTVRPDGLAELQPALLCSADIGEKLAERDPDAIKQVSELIDRMKSRIAVERTRADLDLPGGPH